MGLDMYLRRKVYVGANYEHNKVEIDISIKKDGKELKINKGRITYIEEEAAYWRKCNQIHQWFVTNVQDGEDNCSSYYVSNEQIKNLIDTCKVVRDSLKSSEIKEIEIKEYGGKDKVTIFVNTDVAETLLPSQPGFFFGSTHYDQWYLNDIEHTIEQLESLDLEESEYEYQASW